MKWWRFTVQQAKRATASRYRNFPLNSIKLNCWYPRREMNKVFYLCSKKKKITAHDNKLISANEPFVLELQIKYLQLVTDYLIVTLFYSTRDWRALLLETWSQSAWSKVRCLGWSQIWLFLLLLLLLHLHLLLLSFLFLAKILQLCAQCPLRNMEIVWQRMNEERTERLHSWAEE